MFLLFCNTGQWEVDGAVTLTDCNEGMLRAACQQGGEVVLTCDTQIILTAPIVISVPTTITATDHSVTLSGGGNVRIFVVSGPTATLSLRSVRLINGYHSAPASSNELQVAGGAIRNDGGTVSLIDCVISNNSVNGGGGNGMGGAIFSQKGVVWVTNSVFQGNVATGGNPGAATGAGLGGVIYCEGGQLSIFQSVFQTNSVSNGAAGGGAIYSRAADVQVNGCTFTGNICMASKISSGGGGAIVFEAGTATLSDCQMISNRADTTSVFRPQGGAVWSSADLKLLGCSFRTNSAATGGAAYLTGPTDIRNSTFLENSATGSPGYANPSQGLGAIGGQRGVGGAVAAAGPIGGGMHLMIENCAFGSNLATGGIGAPPFPPSTGGDALGGALYCLGVSTTMEDSTFVSNMARTGSGADGNSPAPLAEGGAIYLELGNASLTNCQIMGNQTRAAAVIDFRSVADTRGGGLWSSADLTLMKCLFSTNEAQALTGLYGHSPGIGGGLCSMGAAKIADCTFVGNRVVGGAGRPSSSGSTSPGEGMGGGVLLASQATLVNSTFYNNDAIGGPGRTNIGPGSVDDTKGGDGMGGGLYLTSSANFQARFTTFWNNHSSGGPAFDRIPPGIGRGSEIYIEPNSPSTSSLIASILANQQGSNVCAGPILDLGFNISSDASPSFSQATSRENTDPRLGTLGDYGGGVLTVPLLPGSPAIDSGPTQGVPPFDERGRTRPFGAGSDIGAYEASPVAPFRSNALLLEVASPIEFLVTYAFRSGQKVTIESSSDLKSWSTVTNGVVGTNYTVGFKVPSAKGQTFYRAIQVNP